MPKEKSKYFLKREETVTAPNGTKIDILADASKKYVRLRQIVKALAYKSFDLTQSLFGMVFRYSKSFNYYTKNVCGGAAYVIELNQVIPILEKFIKLSLLPNNSYSYSCSLIQDNARMEAQCLIELFNREVFDKTDTVITEPIETPEALPISEELAAYLKEEYSPSLSLEQIPVDTLKKLSSLEKECGTGNVVNAIRTEDQIYDCGVRNFLTNEPDEPTFEYICEFARNPEEHQLITEPLPYITQKLADFFKDRVLYMLNYGKSKITPLIGGDEKWTDFPDFALQEFSMLEKEIGTEKIIELTNKLIPISSKFRCAIIDAFCQIYNNDYRFKNVQKFIRMIRDEINKPTNIKEDTQMENFKTTDNPATNMPAQSKVPVVTVADIEDIGDRASYVAKIYGVSLKESLIAATKLKDRL